MNKSIRLALCAATAALSVAACAGGGVKATEVPRITNGGTGVITAPADHMPRQSYRANRATTSSVPTQAGEASTMVHGQPNADPDAPMAGSMSRPDGRTMGNLGSGPAPAAHPSWGTPD